MAARPKRLHPNLSEEELRAVEKIRDELGLGSLADVVRIALHDLFRKKNIKVSLTDFTSVRKDADDD